MKVGTMIARTLMQLCLLSLRLPGCNPGLTSGGAEEFCLEQLGKTVRDVAVLFEAWSLMKGSGELINWSRSKPGLTMP